MATISPTPGSPKAQPTSAPGAPKFIGDGAPVVQPQVTKPATIAPTTDTSTKPPVVASSAPPFMISAVGADRTRWIKFLAYGAQGSGKTELACSAVDIPEMNDVLLIDAERGDMTLEHNPRIKNWEKIKRIPVTNFMEVARIQEYLKAHCVHRDMNNIQRLRENQAFLTGQKTSDIPDEGLWRFKTAIIDTLTEVETYNMYGLMGLSQDQLLVGSKEDIDVAGWDEFRKNNMMVQMLGRAFRDLPMHVIFLCHRTYTQDELKRYHYNVQMTGKLQNQMQALVDMVGFLQTAGEPDPTTGLIPRRLSVQPTSRFAAKNRRSSFKEPHIDNPSMTAILNAVGLLGPKS